MKPVTMFITSWCPYCKQAYAMMKELKNKNPQYANIEVEIIDEELQPKIAKQYDYYYVPTYFVNEVKVHEGVPSIDIIRNVFEEALK
ncbi:thioredoxin family protein [Clostridium algoriphilum]|uniref:thioredoxin family protein n=1 Tax=Clostridium algoriphilum TaxID=198347 RepID=UPI001CF2596A|nr:thioredoxin family protein [Clostridium algoriphilum]MCB2294739.1 thioredoxin family protein [Clostridium algoriphilum]